MLNRPEFHAIHRDESAQPDVPQRGAKNAACKITRNQSKEEKKKLMFLSIARNQSTIQTGRNCGAASTSIRASTAEDFIRGLGQQSNSRIAETNVQTKHSQTSQKHVGSKRVEARSRGYVDPIPRMDCGDGIRGRISNRQMFLSSLRMRSARRDGQR